MENHTTHEGFKEIDVQKAKQIFDEGDAVVLDVREPDEWYGEFGHIENALLIRLDELQNRISEIEKFKNNKILVFCAGGLRSREACEFLSTKGFKNLYNVLGGMMDWFDYGYPTVENNTWATRQKGE